MSAQLVDTKNYIAETSNLSNISGEDISITSKTSSSNWSIWNPLTWLNSSHTNFSIDEAETQMFESIKTTCKRKHVYLRSGAIKIWTISANLDSKLTPIVLLHDFGTGSAMWLHNIDCMSESRPFHAIDMLGFGRSSRPIFSSDPVVAESQFVESIEDWRKQIALDKMILLGHGFGGYLAAAYSLKYSKRVCALILEDPWGFPEKPGAQPDTPTPLWLNAITKASQFISPLSVFRMTGHLGITLLKLLRPDFKKQYRSLLDNTDLIYEYLYAINTRTPSGENGFMAISDYFGYAKMPMIRRIDKVDNEIPIWFIYGSRSWIDPSSGFLSIYLRQNSVYTSVKLISGAGHYVHSDRSREFNEYIKYILELIDEHIEHNQDYPAQLSRCSSHSMLNYN